MPLVSDYIVGSFQWYKIPTSTTKRKQCVLWFPFSSDSQLVSRALRTFSIIIHTLYKSIHVGTHTYMYTRMWLCMTFALIHFVLLYVCLTKALGWLPPLGCGLVMEDEPFELSYRYTLCIHVHIHVHAHVHVSSAKCTCT